MVSDVYECQGLGMNRRDREEWAWIALMLIALAVMIGVTVWPRVGR